MWPFKPTPCALCAVKDDLVTFLKDELRQSQERERGAVNSLLAFTEKPPVLVERKPITDADRKKIQEQEIKALEDAQSLFKDTLDNPGEKLVEV